jgi:hypothetical protein
MTILEGMMPPEPMKEELYDHHHIGILPSQSIMGGPKQHRQQVREIVWYELHSLTETSENSEHGG